MCRYVADFYIDSKTLDWVTREGCPQIFNEYVSDILVDALGINGSSNLFCKCKYRGYNLSWILDNGKEYVKTFSEEELLGALRHKFVGCKLDVSKFEQ